MSRSQQVVQLHVGQTGIQIGAAAWRQVLAEHEVGPDGAPAAPPKDGGLHTLFREKDAKLVPRAVMIDTEPGVTDALKTGRLGGLFDSDNYVAGKEGSANNYARGYHVGAKAMEGAMLERIRAEVGECDGLLGFQVFHSSVGGCGSGLAAKLSELLCTQFGKKTKHFFTIEPSPQVATNVMNPYNWVLLIEQMCMNVDVQIVMDNEAMYRIFRHKLGQRSPRYADLNQLVARIAAATTSATRFGAQGEKNMDLNTMATNLCPYPRINTCYPTYAPIIEEYKIDTTNLSTRKLMHFAMDPQASMLCVDRRHGKFISLSAMYRGDYVLPEILNSFSRMKCQRDIRFVDWAPTAITMAANARKPCCVEGDALPEYKRSLTIISNNTCVQAVSGRCTHKFDILYSKRAFVHWLCGAGVEEKQISDAREDAAARERDFEEIAADAVSEGEEEDSELE